MARLRPRRAYLKIRPKSADLRTQWPTDGRGTEQIRRTVVWKFTPISIFVQIYFLNIFHLPNFQVSSVAPVTYALVEAHYQARPTYSASSNPPLPKQNDMRVSYTYGKMPKLLVVISHTIPAPLQIADTVQKIVF